MFQQAISEPARGRPHIHANLAAHIDAPVLHGPRQLQPAAADIRHLVAQNPEHRLFFHTRAGLLDFLLIHQNPPRQHQRLRALA